jgi:Major Facilitator Superfamily
VNGVNSADLSEVTKRNTQKKNAVLPIFFTVFIDLIGFSILIPIFPLLINNTPFRVTPTGWSAREGLIMLGWLQAIYPLCTFVAAPILGQLSDRFGRRPVLALSIAGTAIGYAIFAVGISAKAIPLLFLGRAIDGLTGGNIAVAQAAIGDVSDDSNRAKNFGLIGARLRYRAISWRTPQRTKSKFLRAFHHPRLVQGHDALLVCVRPLYRQLHTGDHAFPRNNSPERSK